MPEDTPAQKLAMEIKVARVRAGLSQRQLAERVFISKDKISRYELGKSVPDYLFLSAIADATNSNLANFGIGAGESESSEKK